MKPLEDNRTECPRGQQCYVFGVLFPLLYLVSVRRDRQHPFLRFHCIQCLLIFALLIPLIYWNNKDVSGFTGIGELLLFVGYFVALIQAGRRKMFKLPVLGGIAERLTFRL